MKKILLISFALFIGVLTKAQEEPKISGFTRNYLGVLYDNGDFAIIQNTFNVNFEKVGDKMAFKVNPMLFLYDTDSLDLQLREAYMDLYFDNFDIRIGKQQIVWGKADGVFITDVVSPLNLTEFLLPDFDEIRIGVTAVKFDYYLGNNTLELIWKPIFTPTKRPAPRSIWYAEPDFPAPATFNWSKSEVNASLENSEILGKFTAINSAIDFELMGGYIWDANPTMHIEKEFDMSSGSPVLTGLNITPEHHRLYLGGGSFSTDIKGFILRGEAAYYNGKYFQTADPLATDATIQKDYLHYLLGVDFNIGSVKFSTQFIQQYIMDYDDFIDNPETENTMTALARYDILGETLHLELFSYIGLTNNDALIRPKITYDFADGFSFLLGSNIFIGDDSGRFGQYKNNSMIYTKIKYSF
ncbi:MAG: DUF1302 family protein [Bacteroidota bacterium]